MDQQKLRDAIDVVRDLPCVDQIEMDSKRLVISAAESLLAGVPCKVIHAAHGMWGTTTTTAAVPFGLGPGQECDAVIVRLPAEPITTPTEPQP